MAVCEAFIMTGQKMLKLSCDETGTGTNNKIQQNNLNSKFQLKVNHHQQENQNENQVANFENNNKLSQEQIIIENDILQNNDKQLKEYKKLLNSFFDEGGDNRTEINDNTHDSYSKDLPDQEQQQKQLNGFDKKQIIKEEVEDEVEEENVKQLTGIKENNKNISNIESQDKKLDKPQPQQQQETKNQEEDHSSEEIDKGLIHQEKTSSAIRDQDKQIVVQIKPSDADPRSSPERKLSHNSKILDSKVDPFNEKLKMSNTKTQGKQSKKGDENKDDTLITFKAGYLNRKRICDPGGKPTARGRRSWRRVYVVLQDLRIKMRNGIHEDDMIKDAPDAKNDEQNLIDKAKESQSLDDRPINPKSNEKQPPSKKKIAPEKTKSGSTLGFDIKSTCKIHHSLASPTTNYEKREFVFNLRLADRSEFLLQANDEQDMKSWIDSINFASACLSAPALPKAVVNDNEQLSPKSKQQQRNNSQILLRRPILPASYTKLSFWEQLLDHEDRLQRLKQELEEHLAQVPNTRNANKSYKTQFFDRIANLKEDIDRYEIYVKLMQQKSNSPEAMILSKHAKIVSSLTPSNEMMMYIPLK